MNLFSSTLFSFCLCLLALFFFLPFLLHSQYIDSACIHFEFSLSTKPDVDHTTYYSWKKQKTISWPPWAKPALRDKSSNSNRMFFFFCFHGSWVLPQIMGYKSKPCLLFFMKGNWPKRSWIGQLKQCDCLFVCLSLAYRPTKHKVDHIGGGAFGPPSGHRAVKKNARKIQSQIPLPGFDPWTSRLLLRQVRNRSATTPAVVVVTRNYLATVK